MIKIILLVLGIVSFVYGDITVTATVDRTVVPLDGTITLTVEVSGENVEISDFPEFPVSDDWSVQGTSTSTSTSVQIINGKMTMTKTVNLIFYLVPQKVGNLTIPSLKLSAKGKEFSTEPISVRVVQSGQSTRPRTQPIPSPTPPPSQKDRGENIFTAMTSNPDTVFVGQQVTVDLSLYTRQDILNISFGKDAEFKNFWIENLYEAKQLSPRQTVVNGVRYYSVLLRRVAAFPLSAGTHNIRSPQLICTIRHPPRSFFDFGRREEVTLESVVNKITVLPLPQAGKPSFFTGAVGEYSISSKVDHQQLATGEVLTYAVKISGNGNIEALTIPKPQLPPDFEIFDKKEKVTKSPRDGKWGGFKEVEFYLVPRSPGRYIIPPVKFAYFDPYKEKYIIIQTDSIEVNVSGEAGKVSFGTGGKIGVIPTGTDIQFIKPDIEKISAGTFSIKWGTKSLWFLLLDLLAILFAIAYRQRQEHLMENWRVVKSSRALKTARKKLTRARKNDNIHQILGAISDAIFGYLGDKLYTEQGTIILDDTVLKLEEIGVHAETIQELKEILDIVDRTRFAPAEFDINKDDIITRTEQVLQKIDRTIK